MSDYFDLLLAYAGGFCCGGAAVGIYAFRIYLHLVEIIDSDLERSALRKEIR